MEALEAMRVTEVAAQLAALGVRRGGILVVHTSFKAVGPVEGGPEGLIRALREALGPEGTLVMPTMTDGEGVYDPRATPTLHMGIVAETFWRMPGVVRSPHPGASFAAEGPAAEALCAPHPLAPPHGVDSPVGRVWERGGQVLLLGFRHSEDTTLHLAEDVAGVPYRVEHPLVVVEGGVVHTVLVPETDHCCEGFNQADAWLRDSGEQHEGIVGRAHARLAPSRAIVAAAVARLRADPLLFLCAADAGCEECDAARRSVPEGEDPSWAKTAATRRP